MQMIFPFSFLSHIFLPNSTKVRLFQQWSFVSVLDGAFVTSINTHTLNAPTAPSTNRWFVIHLHCSCMCLDSSKSTIYSHDGTLENFALKIIRLQQKCSQQISRRIPQKHSCLWRNSISIQFFINTQLSQLAY